MNLLALSLPYTFHPEFALSKLGLIGRAYRDVSYFAIVRGVLP